MAGQGVETKSGNFEGQLEAFTLERENPYANSKPEGRWRWKIDETKMEMMLPAHIFKGRDLILSGLYKTVATAIPDLRLMKKIEILDTNKGSHLSFEGLEQNFHDLIVKLIKEQHDVEDAEHARHREKINAINTQCKEKLVALRARHSSQSAEFLLRESLARQQQYQQIIRDLYSNSGMAPRDPHGYSNVNASAVGGEVH
ncbi:hypothetical protein SESBI_11429 [Sesbania bispinosa]|nr:hypothetical protein SESBI_11429 [Sesbania bispinosa]